jgi:energy-coupling factor transporter ATP-binding protein EcfA2
MIGIGGPSSTGKSTLAILLSEILKQVTGNSVSIVCQDNFIKENDHCPTVRFVAKSRDKLIYKFLGPGSGGYIDAHDRDCLASCKWEEVERHARAARRGVEIEAVPRDIVVARANVCRAWREAIEKGVGRMRSGVESRLHAVAFRVRVGMVEGNMVLARPERDDEVVDPKHAEETAQARAAKNAGCVPERLSDFLGTDAESKRERLERCYNVKLFLPEGKDVVRATRFRRAEYVDLGKGGSRKAEELWKFEGYFDGVAW